MLYAKLVLANQMEVLNVDNMSEVVFSLMEDETPVRTIFEKIPVLQVLVLPDKAAIKWQLEKKTTTSANAF